MKLRAVIFEKMYKIEQPLARLTKKKKKDSNKEMKEKILQLTPQKYIRS